MLEWSYGFQTLHDDSYNSKVRFKKRNNSIIITKNPILYMLIFFTFFTTNSYPDHLIFGIMIPKTIRYNITSFDTLQEIFFVLPSECMERFTFMYVVILVLFNFSLNLWLWTIQLCSWCLSPSSLMWWLCPTFMEISLIT